MTGSSQNVKEQVDLISNFMEQCLKEWRKYIGSCRQAHYSLNYFTTEQLVYLCEHLASLERNLGLDKGVFPLLQCVLPGVTQEHVQSAVKEAFQEIAAAEREEVTDMPPLEGEEDDLEMKFRLAMRDAGFDDATAARALEAVGPDIDEGNKNWAE